MYVLRIKNLLIVGTMAALILFAFAAKAVDVLAHGESFSIETVVDGYLVDIGQTPEVITTNRSVRFAYDLLDNETNEVVSYTDVWVLIQKVSDQNDRKKTIFASGIHQPRFGSTGMTFTFPESGEYELSVRYQNDEEGSIVDTSVPITVIEEPENDETDLPWLPLTSGLIGLVLGFALTFMLRKKA